MEVDMGAIPVVEDTHQIHSEKNEPAPDATSTHSTTTTSEADVQVDTTKPSCSKPGPAGSPPTLTRILTSLSTTRSHTEPGPPPDGGAKAWLQVLCAHFVCASCWGFVTSFGVFQTYYQAHLPLPQSTISWIGSCQATLTFLVGIGSGRATDAGYFHFLFRTGALLQVLGVMTMSVSTEFWQLLLSQGLCFGIGAGLVFTPTMTLVSTYFSTRKSFAMGIAATGSCTGGLIFPAVVRELLPQIGFGWTVRVVGFIILAFNLFAAAFLRLRLPPRRSGPLVEWSAFREAPYSFYILGMFFIFWSLYFAFFYVGTFSQDIIGLSYTDSINLLLVMVGVGIPARLLPGLVADRKTGPINALIPMASLCGIMFFAWTGIKQTAALYVYAAIYGTGSAGIQSLFPAALSSLTVDLNKAGTRLGMGFFIVSFAVLTGTPIAGALIAADNGQYLYSQIWAGCSMTLGITLLIASRVSKTGWVLRQRV